MSVQSQIDRINQNVADTYTALAEIGADMPSEQNSGNMAGTARTVKAVMYAEQELTEDQKLQARENIGASGKVLQSVVIPDTLVWDGNTEGLQVFDMMKNGEYTFYPVSDKVVTLNDLANGVIIETTIPADDISTEIFVNDFATMHTNVFSSRTIANLLFVSKDNSTLYGNTIPKKGIYFLHSAEYGYVSRIKILGYSGFDSPVEVLKCGHKPVYTAVEVGAVPADKLPEAINTALDQAKASGEFDGYTPKKGVDYYTEADKSEMVNAVLAALPTWQGGSY